MSSSMAKLPWSISPTSVISGSLIVLGFLLTGVSWWFFLLVGVGLFGPGLLREMRWLGDRDEFQRQSDYRAAYHAWLVSGCLAVGLIAFFRSGTRLVEHPQELATLFLAGL